jgi:hypothetical protein
MAFYDNPVSHTASADQHAADKIISIMYLSTPFRSNDRSLCLILQGFLSRDSAPVIGWRAGELLVRI